MPPRSRSSRRGRFSRSWIESGPAGNRPDRFLRFTTESARATIWSVRPVSLSRGLGGLRRCSRRGTSRGTRIRPLRPRKLYGAEADSLAQADRRTLLRASCSDLIGLRLGATAEIEAFENDPASRARVSGSASGCLDRLTGERWARHWLDIVRFGGRKPGVERQAAGKLGPYPRPGLRRRSTPDLPHDEFARLPADRGGRAVPGDVPRCLPPGSSRRGDS